MNVAMATSRDIRTNMRTPSRSKPIAAQPRLNANAMLQSQKNGTSGLGQPKTRAAQNPRMKYEQYLALAGAETQAGDLIAAENYYQHAEHYLRSMRERAN
jgi:hypothetical protein